MIKYCHWWSLIVLTTRVQRWRGHIPNLPVGERVSTPSPMEPRDTRVGPGSHPRTSAASFSGSRRNGSVFPPWKWHARARGRSRHRPVAFLFALDLQPPTAVPFFPRLCNEDQLYLLKLTLTYFKYRPAKTAKTVLFSAAHARSGQQVST